MVHPCVLAAEDRRDGRVEAAWRSRDAADDHDRPWDPGGAAGEGADPWDACARAEVHARVRVRIHSADGVGVAEDAANGAAVEGGSRDAGCGAVAVLRGVGEEGGREHGVGAGAGDAPGDQDQGQGQVRREGRDCGSACRWEEGASSFHVAAGSAEASLLLHAGRWDVAWEIAGRSGPSPDGSVLVPVPVPAMGPTAILVPAVVVAAAADPSFHNSHC